MAAAAVGIGKSTEKPTEEPIGKPTGDCTDKATIVDARSKLKKVETPKTPESAIPDQQAGSDITSPKDLIGAALAGKRHGIEEDSDAESGSEFSDDEDADANQVGKSTEIPEPPPPTQGPPALTPPTPPVSVCPEATAGAAVTDWSQPGFCENPACGRWISLGNLNHTSGRGKDENGNKIPICLNHVKKTNSNIHRKFYFL
jgi:hypothetical protein